jgi:hypothetical protein
MAVRAAVVVVVAALRMVAAGDKQLQGVPQLGIVGCQSWHPWRQRVQSSPWQAMQMAMVRWQHVDVRSCSSGVGGGGSWCGATACVGGGGGDGGGGSGDGWWVGVGVVAVGSMVAMMAGGGAARVSVGAVEVAARVVQAVLRMLRPVGAGCIGQSGSSLGK